MNQLKEAVVEAFWVQNLGREKLVEVPIETWAIHPEMEEEDTSWVSLLLGVDIAQGRVEVDQEANIGKDEGEAQDQAHMKEEDTEEDQELHLDIEGEDQDHQGEEGRQWDLQGDIDGQEDRDLDQDPALE